MQPVVNRRSLMISFIYRVPIKISKDHATKVLLKAQFSNSLSTESVPLRFFALTNRERVVAIKSRIC